MASKRIRFTFSLCSAPRERFWEAQIAESPVRLGHVWLPKEPLGAGVTALSTASASTSVMSPGRGTRVICGPWGVDSSAPPHRRAALFSLATPLTVSRPRVAQERAEREAALLAKSSKRAAKRERQKQKAKEAKRAKGSDDGAGAEQVDGSDNAQSSR
eukprot:6203572-Pleurochrysis_carterae.AAC.3